MKAMITLLLALFALKAPAQQMEGRIYSGQDFLPGATVQIYQAGILKGIRTTGVEGMYFFRTLDVGLYDVLFTYPGCDSVLVKDVVVIPERTTDQGAKLTRSAWEAKCTRLQFAPSDIVTNPTYVSQTNKVEPLPLAYGPRPTGTVYIVDDGGAVVRRIVPKETIQLRESGHYMFNRQDIERMPTTSLNDIISTTPGAYQQRNGNEVQFYGGRTGGNAYYVDGMRQ